MVFPIHQHELAIGIHVSPPSVNGVFYEIRSEKFSLALFYGIQNSCSYLLRITMYSFTSLNGCSVRIK